MVLRSCEGQASPRPPIATAAQDGTHDRYRSRAEALSATRGAAMSAATGRLELFTVKNFRSISKAEKLPLGEFTVLPGPVGRPRLGATGGGDGEAPSRPDRLFRERIRQSRVAGPSRNRADCRLDTAS
jgi:hypothetical protein